MAGEFKGLTVKFRGDDSDLSAALHRISEDTARARGNARDFQKALRFDPGNIDALRGRIDSVGQQLYSANERVDALSQALSEDLDPQAYAKLSARLEAAKADAEKLRLELLDLQATYDVQTTRLGKLATGLQDAGGLMQGLGSGMADVGDTLTTHVTAPILAAAGAAASAAVDIDTALTGVRKTVDGTEEQYEQLKQAAIESSKAQPVSAATILDIEAMGAQLGFTIDELDQFAKVASGLDVATNMNWEQASTNMAQFANIMGMGHDQVERYGSTIVELGNHMATTESDISDMAMRVAAAGNQVGLSEAEVLGLSAALTSMGINAEAGGTAISTIMSTIDKSVAVGNQQVAEYADQMNLSVGEMIRQARTAPETFEQIAAENGTTAKKFTKDLLASYESLDTWAAAANMSAEEFAQAWNESPVDALSAVLSGLEGATEEGGNMAVMLDELGISSLRQTDVMKRLAGNSEFVAEAVRLANGAWEENTALQAEVDNRNESVAAKLEVLRNRAEAVAIEVGGPLVDAAMGALDAAEPLISGVEDMARAFSDMSKKEQLAVIQQVAMVAAAGPVLSTGGRIVDSIGKVTTGIGKGIEAAVRFRSALKGGATAGEALGTALKLNSAVALPSATAAVAALGIAIAGIGLAAAAKDWMDARQRARDLDEAVSGLSANTEGLSAALFTGAGDVDAFGTAAGTAKADIDGLLESVSEHNRRNAETRDSAEESIYMLGQYKQVIDDCAGAGEVDAETTAKLEWALRGLEEATGEAWSAEQVLTGEYEDQEGVARSTKEAIDDLIESKQREARANALQDMYTDALKEQMKAQQEVEKAEKAYHDAHDDWVANATQSYIKQGETAEEAARRAETAWANGEYGHLADDLDAAKTVLEGLNGEVDTYANLMGEAVEQANANWGEREGIIQTTEAMKDACEAAGITNDGIKELAQGLQDAGVSTQQFAQISGEQFAAMVQESGGNVQTLVGLISEYANQAPAEAERGAAGVTGAVAGQVGPTQAAADEQRAAAESAGKFDASASASSSASGVAQGISAALPAVTTAAGSVANAGAKMGDIKGTGAAGLSKALQLASGIGAGRGSVAGAAAGVASAGSGMGNIGDTYGWGAHAGDNLAAGIRSRVSAVAAAAAALAAAAKNQIGHSVPTEGPLHEGGRGEVVYGEHMVDNLVAGMRNRLPEVRMAAAEVAGAARGGLTAGGDWSQKMYAAPSESDIQTRAITSWLGDHLAAGGGNVYVTLQYDASADANDMVRDVARILHDHNAMGG